MKYMNRLYFKSPLNCIFLIKIHKSLYLNIDIKRIENYYNL